jgi:hypothetical protein
MKQIAGPHSKKWINHPKAEGHSESSSKQARGSFRDRVAALAKS